MPMAMSTNKFSAYDRILAFLDMGSVEIIYNESVVAAKGKVNGRSVYAYAQDYSNNAGAMTEDMAEKICSLIASSELYRSLQKNALQHVQKFSFQRYASAVCDLYERLIAT